jgi:hypothetical protein
MFLRWKLIRLLAYATHVKLTAGSLVVLRFSDEVLLVRQRGASHWGLPGGFVRRHELFQEKAAIRELGKERACPARFMPPTWSRLPRTLPIRLLEPSAL